MAIEAKRACGYRKVGGLYLVAGGLSGPCDNLPFALEVCPVCGEGLRWTRSPRRINALRLFGFHHPCSCGMFCPVCMPDDGPHYLLGVGHRQYTPEEFCFETMLQGVSKRIPAVPRDLVLGTTWIYLVHRHAISQFAPDWGVRWPGGVFCAFRPERVELLAWESDCTMRFRACQAARRVTVVPIPDGDPDHTPRGGNTT